MRITPCVSSPAKAVNTYQFKSVKKNPAQFDAFYRTSPKISVNQNFTGNWFSPPISKKKTNYLSYINTTTDSPQEVKNTLLSALNNDNTRDTFINALIQDPKKSQAIVETLTKKLGGKKGFLDFYFAKNGYVANYERYFKKRYENAKSLEELLKLCPNWGYWALERKTCDIMGLRLSQDEMMRDRKANFTFGKLPEAFGGKIKFNRFVNDLKELPFMCKVRYTDDGKIEYVEQLEGGDLSSKNIYKVTDKKGKSYVIKMDRFYPEDILEEKSPNPYHSRAAKETKLLRGDSVYINACIDYYLQLNGYKGNAQLLYYDFKNNVSVYEFLDCKTPQRSEEINVIGQIRGNRDFKELNELGIFLNDIGVNFNYYEDSEGKARIIDVGHSEYIDLLKPGAKLLTFETSDLCGFSIKHALAGTNIDLFKDFDGNKAQNDEDIGYEKMFGNEFAMEYKDFIKQTLKDNIEKQKGIFGENSKKTMYARLMLLEFYKTSILARNEGYADNKEAKIAGILKAMERELDLIDTSTANYNARQLINSYKKFVDGNKRSL